MCGLAGIIWRDAGRPAAVDLVRAMIDVQAHRGPDATGFWSEGPVSLGHCRLSIIDLSPAAGQPMVSRDGRFVAVYNGEIYNYKELRAELADGGAVFFSQSDTEVMIEAYRRWGPGCVGRFNGMWALAVHDRAAGEVFFSRDRFGIKPLYYRLRPEGLVFASEIKAILAAFPDERRVSEPVIRHFLAVGDLDDTGETFFHGIRRLPPACNAVYHLGRGDWRVRRYWDLDREAFRERRLTGDPVERTAELLESAVRLHIRSDVPVGTCLSGGIDSSTIVCLMSRLHSDPVHTFSGIYDDKYCDEREYAAAVNAWVRTEPDEVRPRPAGDYLDDMTRIGWHQDEPTAAPGVYTQFHVMRIARRKVKVILDGQGGDELFAGYLNYFLPYLRDLWESGRIRDRLRASVVLAAMARYWGREWAATILNRRTLGKLAGRSGGRVGLFLQRIVDPAPPLLHPGLIERTRGREIVADQPRRLPGHLDEALYRDTVRSSLPALLRYEDRNSMAWSIEARVPLLDYRLVELALALDAGQKISGSWTKWTLRRAAGRYIPPMVAWRRSKMGYPTPLYRWLREEPERGEIAALLFSDSLTGRELIREDALRIFWARHQAGQDYSWLFHRLLTLEIWHRQYIDGWRPAPAQSPPNGR